jgi:hypothetical protein
MFKSCEISCSIIALILYCIVYYHIYFCLKHRFHFTSSDSPLNVRRRRLIFIMSFKPSNTTSLSPHTHLTPHTSHTLSTHTSISSIYILYRFLYPIYIYFELAYPFPPSTKTHLNYTIVRVYIYRRLTSSMVLQSTSKFLFNK